ncbi:MAG: hypothetical protein PVG39_09585 [Desulfobacteraceae bacterium]
MKRFTFLLSVFLILWTFSSPLQAHYLYLDTVGEQAASAGGQVGLGVYLHVTENDGLDFYSLDLGFDDAALNCSELTYVSVDYGDDGMIPFIYSTEYAAGESIKYSGESLLKYIGRDTPKGATLPIYEDENLLLFTAYFTFAGGDWDGEDLWIEWDPLLSGFGFDSNFYFSLDVYSDSTGAVLLDDNGPDYAAVPIPGAVWLLGSGLAGLGIRRRKAAYKKHTVT